MLQFCFLIEAISYVALIFCTPGTAYITFVLYKILNAISMAGINSGCLNLVYDYVQPKRRVGALALQNTVAGMAGFLTTLVASTAVDHIQASGNMLFGMPVYAQQVLAAFSALLSVATVIYLRTALRRSQRVGSADTV